VNVIRVGREGSPVIVVDEFSLDPQALISRACEADFIDAGSTYPGVRAPAPQNYVDAMLSATSGLIAHHFGAEPSGELDLCAFSMVTTAPAQLRPIQRIPHFDGPEEDRIAFLHYLCGPHQGGTSFFRHLATDLERVTRDRAEDYRQAVVAELREAPPAQCYFVDDALRFERLCRIDAGFNRLIIYRGNALHSGDILSGAVLTEDPRLGRLTINGFGRLRSEC
jgi:uncharacterized protein DUF6445